MYLRRRFFKKDYVWYLQYRSNLENGFHTLPEFFCLVYAPLPVSSKRFLWDYMSVLLRRWNGEVIMMGDFNEVRSRDERRGSCFNLYSAKVFNQFISSSGLVDIKMEGFKKKLQELKVNIRRWIMNKRLQMAGSKNVIINELKVIDKELDQGVVSDVNLLRRLELNRHLHDINVKEASDSFQKSKIKWVI
ncbi:RNA-directed DNA polymerase, eukaryota [Tanacetum coccineum]